MRTLIDLVESLLEAASKPFPIDLYEIIADYVTYGAMSRPDQFDSQFDLLAAELPPPAKPMILYRLLKLTDDQMTRLHQGDLSLEARKYSSWTKSSRALDRLSYERGTGSKVVLRREYNPEAIVIDIRRFYEIWHLNTADYTEWHRYVRPESEVIVRDPPGRLRITPDLVYRIIAPPDESQPVRPPKPGERFRNTSGGMEVVGKLAPPEDQPQGGLFKAETTEGDPVYLRKGPGGKWIEVDR